VACSVTVRIAKTLIAVTLAMSQVVGSTPLQANPCGAKAECCCARKAQPCQCCCSPKLKQSHSCCCGAKQTQHQADAGQRSCHSICGCGCQQSSQQQAPLSPSSHSYELNPRIASSSFDEVLPISSASAVPSARGAHDSHAFYAELPQELLFCTWLI
jgi:hypothetical protein